MAAVSYKMASGGYTLDVMWTPGIPPRTLKETPPPTNDTRGATVTVINFSIPSGGYTLLVSWRPGMSVFSKEYEETPPVPAPVPALSPAPVPALTPAPGPAFSFEHHASIFINYMNEWDEMDEDGGDLHNWHEFIKYLKAVQRRVENIESVMKHTQMFLKVIRNGRTSNPNLKTFCNLNNCVKYIVFCKNKFLSREDEIDLYESLIFILKYIVRKPDNISCTHHYSFFLQRGSTTLDKLEIYRRDMDCFF